MNASPVFLRAVSERITAFHPLSDALRRYSNVAAEQMAKSAAHVEPQALGTPAAHYWFRMTVRSFLAYVEATTYFMRDSVLALYPLGGFELSLGEQVLLSEQRFAIDGVEVKPRPQYNRPLENVRLAFLTFPRMFGVSFALNIGDHRW